MPLGVPTVFSSLFSPIDNRGTLSIVPALYAAISSVHYPAIISPPLRSFPAILCGFTLSVVSSFYAGRPIWRHCMPLLAASIVLAGDSSRCSISHLPPVVFGGDFFAVKGCLPLFSFFFRNFMRNPYKVTIFLAYFRKK